ncbi:MAG: hypothetical protein GXP45_00985 [bacterium]|nr:hypothetical protein [bacterium]
MRIFSNFDTKLKERTLARYQDEFGKDKVVFLVKGKLFTLVKIYFPFFAYLIPSLGILYLFEYLLGEAWFLYGGVPLIILGFFLILGPLLRRFIEYKMDFSIVTPKFLITYNQRGLFDREIKTINTSNIRTVSVEKN